MVAQTAPAVRVAISETLGLPPGTIKPGQLVTGLKKLGFDYVFGALGGTGVSSIIWAVCVVCGAA